jgi:hypothetical protein
MKIRPPIRQQIKTDSGKIARLLKVPLDLSDLLWGNAKLNELFLSSGFRTFVSRSLMIIIEGDADLIANHFQPADSSGLDVTDQIGESNLLNALAAAAQADEYNKDDDAYADINENCSQPGIIHNDLHNP